MERTCVSRVRGTCPPFGDGLESQPVSQPSHQPTQSVSPSPRGPLGNGGLCHGWIWNRWVWRCLLAFSSLAFTAASPTPLCAADLKPIEQAFQKGNYAECRDLARAAIEANEPSERCRILLLKAQLELGEYPQAAESLAAARKTFPYSLELRWLGRDVARYTGRPEQVAVLEEEILTQLRDAGWRYGDPASRLVLGRLLLKQGLEPKRVQEGTYNALKKQQPDYIPAWLAAGELALEKTDFALAAENFTQAVKLDPTQPDAHFGLARAFAPSDEKQATRALQAALQANPRHIPSLLLAADVKIDNEEYDEAETLLDAIEKVNPQQPLSLAYRALLAHLRNQPEKEQRFRQAALSTWPTNPEVDHLLGKKLSQKYRFREGAEAQRRALNFDPKHLPARVQLAQDLLRLGQEQEGWELASAVAQDDGYNIFAHNLATLRETVDRFQTLSADGILLRMDPREAEIYGARVLDLLCRAKRTLAAKYQVELPEPIVVELFPRQADFAIRTFGLPGGEGFLGVCFGTVITANSPASQADRPTCWEATLWHEFCHVVTLNATRNKMPRWLSEGISVYEERLAAPGWGQTITPRTREMLLSDKLTPVSKLSSAFLHPEGPLDLQFAYLESSLVVEYLVEKYGFEGLRKLLADLREGLTINDALGRLAGSIEELDRGFAERAREWARQLAADADWSDPELPRDATAQQLADWLREHPTNYPALVRLARRRVADRDWSQALVPLETMRRLYPEDPTDDGLYGLLARVHRELENEPEEQSALRSLVALNPANVASLDRLTELASKARDWPEVLSQTQRWLSVNPLQATPHRRLAAAATELGNTALAAESYEALLRLEPLDPSELRVRLGQLRLAQGDRRRARREALLALERTPRFRAAQRLLLEATAGTVPTEAKPATPAEAPPAPQDGASKERPPSPDLPRDTNESSTHDAPVQGQEVPP
jgi:tetratricopeptide (TPR) repeat protein